MSSDVLRIISSNAESLALSREGVICIFIYYGEKDSIPGNELALVQLMQAPDGANWIVFQSAEQNTSQKCSAPFFLIDPDEIPFCHARFKTVHQALEVATSYAAVSAQAAVLTIFTVAYAVDSDEYTVESIKVIGDANQEENEGVEKSTTARAMSGNPSGAAASPIQAQKSGASTWLHENRYFLIGLACAILLLIIVLIASVVALRKKLEKVGEKQQDKVDNATDVRPSKSAQRLPKKQVKSPQNATNRVSVTDRRSIKEPVQLR